YTKGPESKVEIVKSSPRPEVVKAHPDNENSDGVSKPERGAVIGVPVGVLIGSLGSVGALAVVLLALTIPWVWRQGAAGPSQWEAVVDEIPETAWVWIWRGVMLAGILLFALPYALPILEWRAPCSSWRHWFIFQAAILIVIQVVIIL